MRLQTQEESGITQKIRSEEASRPKNKEERQEGRIAPLLRNRRALARAIAHEHEHTYVSESRRLWRGVGEKMGRKKANETKTEVKHGGMDTCRLSDSLSQFCKREFFP